MEIIVSYRNKIGKDIEVCWEMLYNYSSVYRTYNEIS